MRLLATLPILICSALAFPRLERFRRACWYGWTGSTMDAHWIRLFNRQPGDTRYHAAKNVLSEWVRLDAQRAGKLFSFLLSLSLILNVVLLIV